MERNINQVGVCPGCNPNLREGAVCTACAACGRGKGDEVWCNCGRIWTVMTPHEAQLALATNCDLLSCRTCSRVWVEVAEPMPLQVYLEQQARGNDV